MWPCAQQLMWLIDNNRVFVSCNLGTQVSKNILGANFSCQEKSCLANLTFWTWNFVQVSVWSHFEASASDAVWHLIRPQKTRSTRFLKGLTVVHVLWVRHRRNTDKIFSKGQNNKKDFTVNFRKSENGGKRFSVTFSLCKTLPKALT